MPIVNPFDTREPKVTSQKIVNPFDVNESKEMPREIVNPFVDTEESRAAQATFTPQSFQDPEALREFESKAQAEGEPSAFSRGDARQPGFSPALAKTIEQIRTEPQSVKGLLKTTGASIATGVSKVPAAVGQLSDFFKPIFTDERKLEAFKEQGAPPITVSKDIQTWLRSNYGDTKLEQLISSSGESLGAMAAAWVSGGTSAVLPAVSVVAGVEKATESIEGGASRGTAAVAGITQAATEYLTEKIPFDIMTGPGKSFISKVAKGGLADMAGEVTAAATEAWLIDEKIRGGEALTVAEYEQLFIDTILVSMITTGAATSITHPLLKKQGEARAPQIPEIAALPPVTPDINAPLLPGGSQSAEPSKVINNPFDVTQEQQPVQQKAIPPQVQAETGIVTTPEGEEANNAIDTGFYKQTDEDPLIELPELLELIKDVNEGKAPQIKEKLNNAYGQLRSRSGPDAKADISLRADIFAGDLLVSTSVAPKDSAALFTEFKKKAIQEFANDETGIKEDELIFRKSFNKKIRKVDFKVFRRNPQFAANVMAHETGHLIDWMDDKDLRKGNVLGRLKSVRDHFKTMIAATPSSFENVITPKERTVIRKEIEIEKGAPPRGTKERIKWRNELSPHEKELWQKAVEERLQEVMAQEASDRGLITKKEIMDELKAISMERKPFDVDADPKYTKYRHSSRELYADAISAMANTPKLFAKLSPKFQAAFYNYLGNKPVVKESFDNILSRSKGGREAIVNNRIRKDYEMMRKGREVRQELRDKPKSMERPKDTIMRWIGDKNWGTLKVLEAQRALGGEAKRRAEEAINLLEKMAYMDAEADNYTYEIQKQIVDIAEANGIDVDDLGVYMLNKRIATERRDLANPGATTEPSANEKLRQLGALWGEAKLSNVQTLARRYHKIRTDLIVSRIEESEMFDPEFVEYVKNNPNYAKFEVLKYLQKRFGDGIGAFVGHKQVGTLDDVDNPFLATAFNDLSILRTITINNSKQSTVKSLADASLLQDAVVKNGIPKKAPDPNLDIFTVMEHGKKKHYYVSKAIVNTYKFAPYEATVIQKIANVIMRPIRELMVNKNPGWMAMNLPKDFWATVMNNPEIKLRHIPALALEYAKANKEVKAAIFNGERSETIKEMLRKGALIPTRGYTSSEQSLDHKLVEVASQLDHVQRKEHMFFVKQIKAVYNWLDNKGKQSEWIGKVAGYNFLKNRIKLQEDVLDHRVRGRVASPNFRARGEATPLLNQLFMYSNVGVQSIRSSVESFKEDPGGFAWKTIAISMLPKLILEAWSLFGDDETKEMIGNISEYDRRMYAPMIISTTENDETVYFRTPQDYQGQFFGAIAYDMAHGRFTGEDSATEDLLNAQPFHLNPWIKAVSGLSDYYLKGINPTEDFHGGHVMSDRVFRAGGSDANKAMAIFTFKTLGGGAIWNPSTNELQKDKSTIQKMLEVAPFNVIGRFIKISDRGRRDRYRKVIEGVRQQKAAEGVERASIVKQSLNKEMGFTGALQEVIASGLLNSSLPQQIQTQMLLKSNDPEIEAYAYANTNDEKIAVLEDIKRVKGPDAFKEMLKEIVDILSKPAKNNEE